MAARRSPARQAEIQVMDRVERTMSGIERPGARGSAPVSAPWPAGSRRWAESEALRIYSEAEMIDGDGPYPPNDFGSSGLSVCEAARHDGLINGETHCLSLSDFTAALMAGPVVLGCNWYDSFESPRSTRLVSVSPHAVGPAGAAAGCPRFTV